MEREGREKQIIEEILYPVFLKYRAVSTDSRQDLQNKIFFAIRGENFDGNSFVMQALDKGAVLAVSDDWSFQDKEKVLVVDDTVKCLQSLSAFYRNNLKIPFIGITGSNGKTTTKELIYRVLSKKYRTFATQGNLNNHIGLPLSILSVKETDEMAVIEIGANHLGETQLLTEIAKPEIGVLTNIGKDHLGEFGGYENVVLAYREFVDYFNHNPELKLVLNHDDLKAISLVNKANCSYFGTSDCEWTGRILDLNPFLTIEVKYNGELIRIKSGLFGTYNLYNILAAAAIGSLMGITTQDFTDAVESYYPQNFRSQVLHWRGNTVILDAYNANPSSMVLALKDFAQINSKKKIIILGDMHELGAYSHSEHENVIMMLKEIQYDMLILVGKEFGKFSETIDCMHFSCVEDLKKWIDNQEITGYTILIKASRSERLEKILDLCYK